MFPPLSMTVTELPGASARLNEIIHMVSEFMRDAPELNRLIAGRESSPRQIAWAVYDAIDYYNSTPPFLGKATINNFPSMSLLLRLCVAHLLESIALLQARNHLSFSDGGISVTVADKHQMLMSWAQMYRAAATERIKSIKRAANVEMAMRGNGLLSEYFIVNGTYIPGY
jgi:hypothetical protein